MPSQMGVGVIGGMTSGMPGPMGGGMPSAPPAASSKSACSMAALAERARVSAKGDKDGSTALYITCFDPLAPVELVRLLASTVYDVDARKNNRGLG